MEFHSFQRNVYLNSALRLPLYKKKPGTLQRLLLIWESKKRCLQCFIWSHCRVDLSKWGPFCGLCLSAAVCITAAAACVSRCASFMTIMTFFFNTLSHFHNFISQPKPIVAHTCLISSFKLYIKTICLHAIQLWHLAMQVALVYLPRFWDTHLWDSAATPIQWRRMECSHNVE